MSELNPKLMSKALSLLGNRQHLADVCGVKKPTVSRWLQNGYDLSTATRALFALKKYRKEVDSLINEMEETLTEKIETTSYRFPPETVTVYRGGAPR